MGQYYTVVNLDKKEFLHPHKFADGMKLVEFGCADYGTMAALALLLSDGNGRGGGDVHSRNPLIGSWAGDRIVIGGDYADGKKWGFDRNAYEESKEAWDDISDDVIAAMGEDEHLRECMVEKLGTGWPGKDLAPGLHKLKEVK